MEGRFITSRSFLIIFEFVYVFTCLCSEEAPGGHISRCPLKVGDTLTPNEMISLAAKLIQQDKEGFITLSNSPEILAKQIFQLLFEQSRHIVILKDFDIFHLDILQAIPMMGDDSDTDIKQEIVNTIAYDPKDTGRSEPRSCSFNLISKECNDWNEYPQLRKGLKIVEKLRKKRLLVVNNNRRNFTGSGNSSDIRASVDEQVQKLLKLRKEHLKQPNTYNNKTRRLESLGEYFDSIINYMKNQNGNDTTANILNQSEDETKESGSEELKTQMDSNEPEVEVQVEVDKGNDKMNSPSDGRRILGIPTIPTRKPK